jgi:hypothetical protein
MITLLLHLFRLLPFLFGGHRQLALENLALRHQLSVYKRTTARPNHDSSKGLKEDVSEYSSGESSSSAEHH